MLHINFNLNSKSEKETTIISVLRFSGNRIKISLGFMGCPKIPPKNWNDTKQRARGGNSKFINYQIGRFARAANDEFKELAMHGTPDKNELKQAIMMRLTGQSLGNDNTISSYIDKFISESKTTKAPTTIKAYTTVKNIFEAYQTHKRRKYEFKDTNYTFVKDFEKYLMGTNKSPNYIYKIIRMLKTIIRDAATKNIHDYEYHKQDYFKGRQTPTKEEIYLTEAELKKLYRLELDRQNLKDIRDLFLMGCYSGLRYSDFKRLDYSNMNDGFITIRTQKTEKDVVIPLHPVIRFILSERGGHLPKSYSNQYFNREIKKIGKMAGIDEKVNVTHRKGNNSFTKTQPKYELLKTHTARRTFCTNAILSGMAAHQIMKITGHGSLVSFEKYIKMSGKEAAVIMAEHDFFKERVMKVAQ